MFIVVVDVVVGVKIMFYGWNTNSLIYMNIKSILSAL